MNGKVDVVAAAVHRALIHARGVPAHFHTGGTLSTGGALLVALMLVGALAVGVIGWRLDRRGARGVSGAAVSADEAPQRREPGKPSAAAPLRRGVVGVLQRRQSPKRRSDRDGMV